ncbi:MAG: polysaccharide biosynthesis/export family protein [bacterium]|nr:polysaccharide biosynthesis/export family protein [bacterium]
MCFGLALGGAGCGLQRDVGLSTPPENVAVRDVVSERDRERLQALAAERSGGDPRRGYRIGPDDLLEVRIPELLESGNRGPAELSRGIVAATVPGVPTFTQGFRVGADGVITLPLLGPVRAEGLTTSELEALLAQRLVRADILRKPQVTVSLAEYRSGVVAVMGTVEKPGLYPVTRPGATIADVVWAAGGPTKEAGRIVAFTPAGQADPIRLDLETLIQPDSDEERRMNVRVAAGDVVSISPAGNVLVDGWVEKPGAYPVTRGLTLAGAIAAAGGNHFAADRRQAVVKRSVGPNEQKMYVVDLDAVASGAAPDMPLADGDVVSVPPSTARLIPWGMWKVTTGMVAIGASIPIF